MVRAGRGKRGGKEEGKEGPQWRRFFSDGGGGSGDGGVRRTKRALVRAFFFPEEGKRGFPVPKLGFE